MDPLDWALICELSSNARTSYQALSRKFNLSPNTVKNRISKLCKQGVITGFGVIASMNMLGAEHVVSVISTDGSENVIDFMEQIVTQPMVCEVYRTGDMCYELWAMVSGASETLGLKRFLQDLKGVTNVEMRPIIFFFPNKSPNHFLNTRGERVSFTHNQLRVLRCLFDDCRMRVSQIAKQTGFTSRRVQRILRELYEGGGVHFVIGYNIFALGDMEYRLRIRFDNAQTNGREIVLGLYEKYPNKFWWASITTNEPIVDVGLIIDRPGDAVPIINAIKAATSTRLVEDFVSYPRVVRANNPLKARLFEIFTEAGLK